jgi:hypothetical protein
VGDYGELVGKLEDTRYKRLIEEQGCLMLREEYDADRE